MCWSWRATPPRLPLRSTSCLPPGPHPRSGCPPRLHPLMLEIFALSLQSEIEKYGAYAGFAAIPALAVLALLYFAQAREVKRLREWAGRAPERAQELQERVTSHAQVPRPSTPEGERRVVAQPAGAGTAAGAGGAAGPTTQPPA